RLRQIVPHDDRDRGHPRRRQPRRPSRARRGRRPGQRPAWRSWRRHSLCARLHGLIDDLLAAAPDLRFLRDATRGGLATVLNEIAEAFQVAVEIDETATPIREDVKAFCEILGLDPLYLANEGKIIVVAPPEEAGAALAAMRAHPLGVSAAIVGRVQPGEPG